MPTVAVDKADLFERLGKEYSECIAHRTFDQSLTFRPLSHGGV